MASGFTDLLKALPGLVIEMADGYQHPRYPPVDSDAGAEICQAYRDLLERNQVKLRGLKPRRILPLRAKDGANGERIGFTASRRGMSTGRRPGFT